MTDRNARHRAYYAANLEAMRAKGRARYHANKEAIAKRRKAKRAVPELHAKERAYHREYARTKVKRKYKYGITDAEFKAKLASQGGVCAICRCTEPGGRGDWVLDHNHDFDKRNPAGWRGVLCVRCNVMVGMSRERASTLLSAIAYLDLWSATKVSDAAE